MPVLERGGGRVDRSAPSRATSADYLILSSNLLRIGVFRYSKSKDLSVMLKEQADTQVASIESIYAAVKALENGEQLTGLQADLLEQGSSMDGMRPKSFTIIDDESWIVKFPSKNDYDNQAVGEFLGMKLAAACGIETPEVALIALGDNKQVVAVKRF